jgi:hypothetical protein
MERNKKCKLIAALAKHAWGDTLVGALWGKGVYWPEGSWRQLVKLHESGLLFCSKLLAQCRNLDSLNQAGPSSENQFNAPTDQQAM